MSFKKGYCRIETKNSIIYGEITEVSDTFITVIEYSPMMVQIEIDKSKIVSYEPIAEDDIPPYE